LGKGQRPGACRSAPMKNRSPEACHEEGMTSNVCPAAASDQASRASPQSRLQQEVDKLREGLEDLRDQGKDRDISFTRALASRVKREEALQDLSAWATESIAKPLQEVLNASRTECLELVQMLGDRLGKLEQSCEEKLNQVTTRITKNGSAQIERGNFEQEDFKHPTIPVSSPGDADMEGLSCQKVLSLTCLNANILALNERCQQQEHDLSRLAGLLDDFVGGSAQDRELFRQVPAVMDRVEYLSSSVDKLHKDTQQALRGERREREHLVQRLSGLFVSDNGNSAPEVASQRAGPPSSYEPAPRHFSSPVRHSTPPPPRFHAGPQNVTPGSAGGKAGGPSLSGSIVGVGGSGAPLASVVGMHSPRSPLKRCVSVNPSANVSPPRMVNLSPPRVVCSSSAATLPMGTSQTISSQQQPSPNVTHRRTVRSSSRPIIYPGVVPRLTSEPSGQSPAPQQCLVWPVERGSLRRPRTSATSPLMSPSQLDGP